ncbi:hypothetical protein HBH45_136200 [Parastagonospora nodorum]|nr:hypothetical protein HBH45_136200 [Parastagonospora nodorum]
MQETGHRVRSEARKRHSPQVSQPQSHQRVRHQQQCSPHLAKSALLASAKGIPKAPNPALWYVSAPEAEVGSVKASSD